MSLPSDNNQLRKQCDVSFEGDKLTVVHRDSKLSVTVELSGGSRWKAVAAAFDELRKKARAAKKPRAKKKTTTKRKAKAGKSKPKDT